MSDFQTYRSAAIRYWERRRIVYNLALTPPALLGYAATSAFGVASSQPRFGVGGLVVWFVVAAIIANVLYSLAYATEFWFGSADLASRWQRFVRPALLVSGILLGMLLALKGGREIAGMRYGWAEFPQQN